MSSAPFQLEARLQLVLLIIERHSKAKRNEGMGREWKGKEGNQFVVVVLKRGKCVRAKMKNEVRALGPSPSLARQVFAL